MDNERESKNENLAEDKAAVQKSEQENNENHSTRSKEEMARMIAKKLNEKSVSDDMDVDLQDISQRVYEHPERTENRFEGSVKTAVKPDVSNNKKTAESHQKKTSQQKKNKGRKKMSAGKTAGIICLTAVGIVVVAVASIYLVGLNTYKGVFLDNTYINNVNVSGKTEAEAYRLITSEDNKIDKIKITKLDGTDVNIKMSDIGHVDDTKARIAQYYSQQNHYGWIKSKFKNTEFNYESDFRYEKNKLEEQVKEKLIDAAGAKEPTDAYIAESDDDNGYVVVKETSGNKIDPAKSDVLYKYIEDKVNNGEFNIDISSVDCYQKAKITSDDLQKTCDKLNSLKNMELKFDFTYTKETLNGNSIMKWVTLADDGESFEVDRDKVMTYVEGLADKYDTFKKDRKFKTTKRGTITMPEGEGCYGWWIDQEKTCDMIVDAIKDGKSETTEPVYYVNPDSQYTYTCNPEWRTKDSDFSNTYIEVDLKNQHLWYYENGKLKMQSDIVSGYSGSQERKTPAGVYKLWYKETGKTLVGASDGISYASYVDYWNYISTIGIGLHDASWQNGDFNKNKYKTSTWGSHGCINMPFEKAKYVYDNVHMNSPVFIYW